MTTMTTDVARGLEGVVVAETELSWVDGANGRLVLRGVDVGELARRGTFEAAAALLLGVDEGEVRRRLGAARVAAAGAFGGGSGRAAPADVSAFAERDAMTALRAHTASLPSVEDALALVASVGVATAAWVAARAGRGLEAPDPGAHHAADLMRLATGRDEPALGVALARYLATVIDHGMNASTFAARVVASTGSDLVSCVTAGLGALKGPLHGGAPGPVLDMLDAVRASGHGPAAWLAAELAAGRRIMGMGHRVYRTRDPRAAVLEEVADGLAAAGVPSRLAEARAVEEAARRLLAERYPERRLDTNVELMTAVVLDALGLPRESFTAWFAAGRVAGWCAHVAEQRLPEHQRLIRPEARYVGLVDGARRSR